MITSHVNQEFFEKMFSKFKIDYTEHIHYKQGQVEAETKSEIAQTQSRFENHTLLFANAGHVVFVFIHCASD